MCSQLPLEDTNSSTRRGGKRKRGRDRPTGTRRHKQNSTDTSSVGATRNFRTAGKKTDSIHKIVNFGKVVAAVCCEDSELATRFPSRRHF